MSVRVPGTVVTLRGTLRAGSVDDDEIRDVISHSQARYGGVLCPHTATAARMYERLRTAGDEADYALVATAHAAKFEQVVEPLVGIAVPVPPTLQTLLQRPATAQLLSATYTDLISALAAP